MRDDERAATRICCLNFFETGDCALCGVMEVFPFSRVMGSGVALEGDRSFGESSLYLDTG
jgi:hypothetical protein